MSKNKPKCAGTMWIGIGVGYRSCTNNGTLEHDGAHWCRIHHPPTVQAKAKKRQEAWEAEWNAKQARWDHQEKTNKLRGLAVEYLREHHPDALAALAKEVGL